MRYRITFKDPVHPPVDVEAYDIKIIGDRRVELLNGYGVATNEVSFCMDIKRIADSHDRTVLLVGEVVHV